MIFPVQRRIQTGNITRDIFINKRRERANIYVNVNFVLREEVDNSHIFWTQIQKKISDRYLSQRSLARIGKSCENCCQQIILRFVITLKKTSQFTRKI